MKRHKVGDTIKWVIIFVLVLGLIGVVTGLSIKVDRQTTTTTLNGESYNFGALDDNGQYEESNISIFTPKGVTVDGLTVVPAKDAEIEYKLFFYDDEDYFISATKTLQVAFNGTIPDDAVAIRIMITPTADKDGKITLLEVFKYADMLTVRFNK